MGKFCGICQRQTCSVKSKDDGDHDEAVGFCSLPCFHKYLKLISRQSKPKWVDLVRRAGELGTLQSEPKNTYSPVLGKFFRSGYEARVAEWFNLNGIPILHEPHQIQVGKKIYIPDFYLPQAGVWVEVKGRWSMGSEVQFGKALEKLTMRRMLLLPWRMHDMFRKEVMARVPEFHDGVFK